MAPVSVTRYFGRSKRREKKKLLVEFDTNFAFNGYDKLNFKPDFPNKSVFSLLEEIQKWLNDFFHLSEA
jgi:hypothetical protein